MRLSELLAAEWRPALGCTEPAAVAYAAAVAASQAEGPVRRARLVLDPRMFKNCFAVGIPNSEHKSGVRWALAIGALLPRADLKLESFRAATPEILAGAEALLAADALTVDVDPARTELFVDCVVERAGGRGRAVLEREHTRLTRIERNGVAVPPPPAAPGAPQDGASPRAALTRLSLEELIDLARSATPDDRARLDEGAALNLAIARHGLAAFPPSFAAADGDGFAGRAGRLVCAGVHARMSGEDFVVMTLAGSGNKGITASVPLALRGEEGHAPKERVQEALALSCVMASLTTHHLGPLSAVCGGANAAGIGLACGLVLLGGGGPAEISLAVNNLVGNLAGMVCDGAKIGCGLKTMTAVDAAFRAASLARAGVGIPATDGIVGADGLASLSNLGRLAVRGMAGTDAEILEIMRAKLR